MTMTTLEFLTRLGTALFVGAAIGLERQWRQKSAGLRTNTLVSTGAAGYLLLSLSMTGSSGDPSRVASQIVTGIGFLGAGVIMKDGLSVQGLNTAATIWCTGAVGALAGAGLLLESVIVGATVMLTHIFLRPISLFLNRMAFPVKNSAEQADYAFTIKCKAEVENHIRVLLLHYLSNDERLLLKSLTSDDNGEPANAVITALIHTNGTQDNLIEKVASRLTIEDKVSKVSWEIIGRGADS